MAIPAIFLTNVNVSWSVVRCYSWPAGVPAGTNLWWQTWVQDPAAPHGVSATNCLRSTSP